MKIRNGFVSNSSSSSFVIAVKKDVHEKVLKQLTEYEKDVIEQIAEKDTIFGIDVYTVSDMTDMDGNSWTFGDLPINEEAKNGESESPWDVLDRYEILVLQNENARWGWSI